LRKSDSLQLNEITGFGDGTILEINYPSKPQPSKRESKRIVKVPKLGGREEEKDLGLASEGKQEGKLRLIPRGRGEKNLPESGLKVGVESVDEVKGVKVQDTKKTRRILQTRSKRRKNQRCTMLKEKKLGSQLVEVLQNRKV